MNKQWVHLNNFFLTRTKDSARLCVRISKKHDSALQAASAGGDVFFTGLYTAYHPLHTALVTAYDIWLSQTGSQQGQTYSLTQLLSQLRSTKAENWTVAVKNVYPKNTAKFTSLFPNLKKPFQAGSQQGKIDAVKALSIAIGTDASLTTVKTDVDAFYTSLNNAHANQKGSITTTSNFSDAVELARVNSCVGQFADYGALIQKYATHPEQVGNYFDKAALRNNVQVLFQHQVKKNSVNLVVKRRSVPDDAFLLENNGSVALVFGFVLHKDDHPGAVSVTVAPNTNVTVMASDLGDDLDHNHYLVCRNADLNMDGLLTVEII